MWFFMNSCYLISVITFLLLVIGFFQNLFSFFIFKANHLTFMLLTSIIYLFTETLVIFFFVGTGVSIKEFTLTHHLPAEYHKTSIQIKRNIYPPLLLNMLFLIMLFIMVGAVVTGHVPVWIYRLFFIFCIYHFIKVKIIQHACFKKNTENILAMVGISGQDKTSL